MRPFISILFLLGFNGLFAQTCCTAGPPLNSALSIESSTEKGIGLRLTYNYKGINRLVSEDEVLPADERGRSGSNLILALDHNLSEHWSIGVILPWVFQSRQTFSQEQSTNGLGDAIVVGQYNAKLGKDWESFFSMGIKLPSGKSNHADLSLITFSPDMQSGSNTVDLLFNLGISKAHFVRPNVTVAADYVFRYNTVNSSFAQRDNFAGRSFKFGNQQEVNVKASYLITLKKSFLQPLVGISGLYIQPNEEQGNLANNSGGLWMFSKVGLIWIKSDLFNIETNYGIPLYQNLDGIQISTNREINLTLRYKFLSKSKQDTDFIEFKNFKL